MDVNDSKSTILRILIYYILPSERQSMQLLNPNFPLQKFQRIENVETFLKDGMDSGFSERNVNRVCFVGNQGSGKTSLARTLKKFLETNKEKSFLTEEHQEYIETKLVEIIPEIKSQSAFLATKSTDEFPKKCQISTVTFKDKEEESQRYCIMNVFDCGGHTEYTGCHAIFSTNNSSYVLAFDG